jgi:hypothetical protein
MFFRIGDLPAGAPATTLSTLRMPLGRGKGIRSGSTPTARYSGFILPRASRAERKLLQLPTTISIGCSDRPIRIEAAIIIPGEISCWIAR